MNYQMAYPNFPKKEISWLLKEFKDILNGDAPLSMGQRVKEFEESFAKYIGAKYAVGTNSCSAALEIALQSIGLKNGDEVIVPVQTFVATGFAVSNAGGNPIFCDIDSRTFCMSLVELKKNLSSKTKAVILVHMAGMISPDALKIKDFCNKKNIILIEDAAHAIGSSIQDVKAGNIGDISCFSFYPTKTITTAEGGMLLCSNKELYEIADSLRNRGRDMSRKSEIYSLLGTNNRMTEFAALMGISQLNCLEEFLRIRSIVANIYNSAIIGSSISHLVETLIVPSEINHSYWRYIITLDSSVKREFVRDYLSENNIASDWAYYPPLHLQPYFIQSKNTFKGQCPVAEDILERNFCLPINTLMQEKDAEFIVDKFIQAVIKCI